MDNSPLLDTIQVYCVVDWQCRRYLFQVSSCCDDECARNSSEILMNTKKFRFPKNVQGIKPQVNMHIYMCVYTI